VSPITTEEIPHRDAIDTALRTSISAPTMREINPTIRRTTARIEISLT
jgi:hypothetical protein